MKVFLKNKNKIYLGVFGLPNSGTTLLSSSFHCAENGFCLCEPHLGFLSGVGQRVRMLDKIGFSFKKMAIFSKFPRLKNGDFITNYKSINKKLFNYLKFNNNYSIGGIKECYWTDKINPNQKSVFDDVFPSDYYDIVLFIFREPKVMYLSQIAKGDVSVSGFISDYKSFYKKYKNFAFDNKFLINYEKLCFYGSNYLNQVLSEHMFLDGEISLHPTSFATGSWSLKNLEKNKMLNQSVNKPKTIDDFDIKVLEEQKDALEQIDKDLGGYNFLWK